jgi:hypothetical protein
MAGEFCEGTPLSLFNFPSVARNVVSIQKGRFLSQLSPSLLSFLLVTCRITDIVYTSVEFNLEDRGGILLRNAGICRQDYKFTTQMNRI